MTDTAISFATGWRYRNTWSGASGDTLRCLPGCAVGGFGTIAFFQATGIPWPTMAIMGLAVVNGLLTAIALETCILARQLDLRTAFRTAAGMSLISMISMEIAMNAVDVAVTGGAVLPWWVLLTVLLAGFPTPLPCNNWRLEANGRTCN